MRIIKLVEKTPAESTDLSVARIYLNKEDKIAFRLGPNGQFNSRNKIKVGDLDAGEPLAFFLDKKIVYIADVKSGVQHHEKGGGERKFFCVDETTIEVGDGSTWYDVQKELDRIPGYMPNITSNRQVWNRIEIEHGLARQLLQKFVDKQAQPNVMDNPALNSITLDEKGKRLLAFLVSKLESAVAGQPKTYTTYGECLSYLGIKEITERTHGEMLCKEGLTNLAEWIKAKDLPAITGLIVSQESYKPSNGYYSVYGKSEDYIWWRGEIQKSKNFDWSAYVSFDNEKQPDAKDGIPGREACDVNEPPARVECKTLRIIRDTKLSHEIKEKNDYTCQLCREPLCIDESTGEKYAEAHHIQPLGEPHNGPDVLANMICVCPNCHALLDYRAIKLPNAADIGGVHEIGQEYIDYHNRAVNKS